MYIKNPPRVFLNSKTDWFYILFVFCCTDSHKVDERRNHTCWPSRLAREAPDILARMNKSFGFNSRIANFVKNPVAIFVDKARTADWSFIFGNCCIIISSYSGFFITENE